MPDRAGDIALRQRNRVFERVAQRKMRGDGRGKRAARAVRCRPGDALGRELGESLAVVQQVDDVSATADARP